MIEAIASKPLTGRQLEVARLLACGHSKKGIAHELHISHHTVTRHIADIYERLGVSDRVELVFSLLRAGEIRVEDGPIARMEHA